MSRLPTLEDLAKRIVPNGVPTNPSHSSSTSGVLAGPPQASRSRLPQSILAGRATREGDLSSGTNALTGDEPPKEIPKDKIHRGYKNIPSLDAIASRLRAKSVSANSPSPTDPVQSAADGVSSLTLDDTKTSPELLKAPQPVSPLQTEKTLSSPELETASSAAQMTDNTISTATSGTPESPILHPLQHAWALFHDSKSRGAVMTADPAQTKFTDAAENAASQEEEYAAGLTVVGEFETVEDFCRWFNWLKPPSQLEMNSNYHLFKKGIKPMWEDEANANGGKWVLTMKSNPQLLDRCWSWLTMALVGEELDERDEICGAVVSLRPKHDRIQLWTRSKDDVERINSIGKRVLKLLDVNQEDGIGFEFQYHSGDRPIRSKFFTVQPSSTTYHRPAPGPGSTFGSAIFGKGSVFGGTGHAQPKGSMTA
ncbi:translation initiation factor eIF 4e-like domain-containing protein [Cantharellus anzutake]|uniref:translation initiation factor eIF 4e-like domain-containing protein n=1 Tax=Cantharellus anzutake TaxID=1750568 RepID=UPI001903FB7B|nr:translation initiation factor eIF 4e-like domain-containing protein [Cantharellus anzutake]KAF8325777.1 translation initiation factor eIF 4e-like domain-containing protein [Cantharellus anzutake]